MLTRKSRPGVPVTYRDILNGYVSFRYMVDTFNNSEFLHIALTIGLAVRPLAQGRINHVAEP